MLQNNNPRTDVEQKQMLQTLADVCQGLISILPLDDAPYCITVENEDDILNVKINGKSGTKFATNLKVSKINGEEFVEAFRDYFIREREIYISYFDKINHEHLCEYKYSMNHINVDENVARRHVIQNHMYTFVVNRYYGLSVYDLDAHDRAINKMNKANQKVMELK